MNTADRKRSRNLAGTNANWRPGGPRHRPVVYPALLSRVANAFRRRIRLASRTKDGLTYLSTFNGRQAVDIMIRIIKTPDRSIALLLGRALEAQKFFRDVTYKHNLRDSPTHLYRFSYPGLVILSETKRGKAKQSNLVKKDPASLPSGIFTPLTKCYSPGCSRDRTCYSYSCPGRQPLTVGVSASPKPVVTNTTRNTSIMADRASKRSLIERGLREPGRASIHSAPKLTSDSVKDQERKRREAIDEVIHTEYVFVRDLEYLRNRWMEPLRTWGIIPDERRLDFVQQVFWNIEDILNVNTRVHDLLIKRQNANPNIETIGSTYAKMVPHFYSFVEYGKRQPYGQYEFETEKSTNPTFAAFVETVERLPESRRLGLNVYLIKPVVHLARYPSMLEVVLSHTPEHNSDRVAIPKVIEAIRELLAKLYEQCGRSEDLVRLEKRLVFKHGEEIDLRLGDKKRQLMHRGSLEQRGRSNKSDVVHTFLFDHMLLIVKSNMIGQHEKWEVFKRPIPLELLAVFTLDQDAGNAPKPRSPESKRRLIVRHCGRNGYTLTLWAPTEVARDQWVQNVTAQQEVICKRNMMFNTHTLSEGVFLGDAKVNCVAPYGSGRRFAYGTDNGVYLQSLDNDQTRIPIRKLSFMNTQQIDVLEDYQLLIILTERSVLTFPLDVFDVEDPMRHGEYPLKHMKRITSHTSFFKVGYCLGRTLVCIVEARPSNSTIKVFEPIAQSIRNKSKPTYKDLLRGGSDMLEVFKEFYIPSKAHSINFLRTKLCVAFTTGFEIVDLETLDTQALLDPLHISLEFLRRRKDARPLNIYLIDGEYLLCYTEFAFFVNRHGERSKNDDIIHWEGSPTAFALHYPYIMAFDPTFIEIRHVKDGKLVQIGGGKNLRLLFADAQPSIKSSKTSKVPIARVRDEIIIVSDDKVMAVRPAHRPSQKVR
ncbi:putative Rho guanyl-nucleotide exchange factor [Rhizoctonia solani 123E]|uniref:Putative Rho guanyl-nucleotide exchange factor n=1 Tax=Rhizoctonia solani 123E TaxID=1423351 RepID=A0A074RNQ7_9AGAM|nr:putative Rho guanyl-nucleotide exchange factor [Rhizoctonia solani 123E]